MSNSTLNRRALGSRSPGKKPVSDNSDITKESSKFRDRLLRHDVDLTAKFAVCADSDSALGFLRPLMKFLEYSCHGIPWIGGAVVGILASHDPSLLQILLNLLLVLLFDLLIVGVSKLAVRRDRPQHNRPDMFATVSVDNHAFPSGHSTRAVAVTLFILNTFALSRTVQTALCVWMVAVCVSRVLLGRHHVLDVLVGAALGGCEYVVLVYFLWLSQETCMKLMQPIHEEVHL